MKNKTLVFITFTMSLALGVIIGQISNKESNKSDTIALLTDGDYADCTTNSEYKTETGDSIVTSASDVDCLRRKAARVLASKGDYAGAKDIMCGSNVVREAFKQSGNPCK
jgi:hypothetical protein